MVQIEFLSNPFSFWGSESEACAVACLTGGISFSCWHFLIDFKDLYKSFNFHVFENGGSITSTARPCFCFLFEEEQRWVAPWVAVTYVGVLAEVPFFLDNDVETSKTMTPTLWSVIICFLLLGNGSLHLLAIGDCCFRFWLREGDLIYSKAFIKWSFILLTENCKVATLTSKMITASGMWYICRSMMRISLWVAWVWSQLPQAWVSVFWRNPFKCFRQKFCPRCVSLYKVSILELTSMSFPSSYPRLKLVTINSFYGWTSPEKKQQSAPVSKRKPKTSWNWPGG